MGCSHSSLGVEPAGEPALVRRRTIGTVTYEEKLHALEPKVAEIRRWGKDGELEWVAADALDGAGELDRLESRDQLLEQFRNRLLQDTLLPLYRLFLQLSCSARPWVQKS